MTSATSIQSYGRLLAVLVLTGFLSPAVSIRANAQIEAPPLCSPDMLDIGVLPPFGRETVKEIRAMVIELQNRAQSVCTLPPAPYIALLPQDGADSFTGNDYEDDDPAATDFKKIQYDLGPGEVVHTIIVWPSRASWNSFPGCFSRDRLAMGFEFNVPPLLEVEHLWARLYDRAYVSRFRLGHYAGLKRFSAQEADLAVTAELGEADNKQPSIGLESKLDREMLNDPVYSDLFLELPHLDFDCPLSYCASVRQMGRQRSS